VIKILTDSGVPNMGTVRNSSTSRSDLTKSFAESDNQSLNHINNNLEQSIPRGAFVKHRVNFPHYSHENGDAYSSPRREVNGSQTHFGSDQLDCLTSIESLKAEHRKSKVLIKVSKESVMHLTAGNSIIQSLLQLIAGYIQNLKFFLDLSFGLQNLFSAFMIAFLVQLLGNSTSLFWIILTLIQFNLILVLLRNAKVRMHLKAKLGNYSRLSGFSTHELFDLLIKKVEKKIDRLFATNSSSIQRIANDSPMHEADFETTEKLFWIKSEIDKQISGYLQLTLKQNSVYLKFFAPLDLEVIDRFEVLRQDLSTMLSGLLENSLRPSSKLSAGEDQIPSVKIQKTPSLHMDSPSVKLLSETKRETNDEEVKEHKLEKSELIENENFNAESLDQPAVKEPPSPQLVESMNPESLPYIDAMFDRKLSAYQEYTANINEFRIEEEKPTHKIYSRTDPVFITKMCKLSIHAKTSQILESLADPSILKTINPLMESYHKVKQFSETHWLSSMIIKAPFPMSNREFASYSITRQIDDRRTIVMTFQCTEKVWPLNKKYVRGELTRRH